MGTQFRNEAQVRRYLLPKMQITVDYVLGKIYDLNQQKINEVVYAVYNPTEYERTYQFREAWNFDNSKASGIHVKGEFYYEPEEMEYIKEHGQHGTPEDLLPHTRFFNGGGIGSGRYYGDERKYLAEVIYEGLAGNLFGFGPWCHKRDAWGALIKALDGDLLASYFKDGCRKAGLNVKFNHSMGMDIKK